MKEIIKLIGAQKALDKAFKPWQIMSKAYKPWQDAMRFLKQKRTVIRLNHLSPTKIPSITPNPTEDKTKNIHDWHDKPLGKIAIGIIIGIFVWIAIWIINYYFPFIKL